MASLLAASEVREFERGLEIVLAWKAVPVLSDDVVRRGAMAVTYKVAAGVADLGATFGFDVTISTNSYEWNRESNFKATYVRMEFENAKPDMVVFLKGIAEGARRRAEAE